MRKSSSAGPGRGVWPPWALPVLIFAVSLSNRFAVIWFTQAYLYPENTEVVNIAASLARGDGFANAFGPGSGPSAHCAPLYPMLLSLLFRLLGTGSVSVIAQSVLSCALASLTYALLPSLAETCGMPRRAGVWAGFAAALLPLNFWSETKGTFESSLSALLLLAIVWHTVSLWTGRPLTRRHAIGGGVLWGLGLLATPAVSSFLLGAQLAAAFRFRRAYLPYAACLLLVVAAFLAPWTWRNQRVLGEPIWSRDNLGLELSTSNHDDARPTFLDNRQTAMCLRHPNADTAERALLIRVGEVGYERLRLAEAKSWIAAHPRRFLALSLQRAALYWFPAMQRPAQTLAMSLVSALGLVGLFCWLRAGSPAAQVFAALYVTYPLVYYAVQAFPRFRHPMEWTLWLLGGYAILRIFDALKPTPAHANRFLKRFLVTCNPCAQTAVRFRNR